MDGEEAVRLAKAVRPDVILMDINMPRMDGIQAAKGSWRVPSGRVSHRLFR